LLHAAGAYRHAEHAQYGVHPTLEEAREYVEAVAMSVVK